MENSSYCILLLTCLMVCAMATPNRPHIVLFIADDLGWSDVSFHGSKQIPTPNIDAIARDGIILNNYYVQPLCSPSRASLMTGKYATKLGFQHNVIVADSPWGLSLNETILPQYFKSLGYATHALGKWHLGYYKDAYTPVYRGFDSFFGFYTGLEDYFTHFSENDYHCIVDPNGVRNDHCDMKSKHRERFPKTVQRRYLMTGYETGLDLHKRLKSDWNYNAVYGPDLYTAKAKQLIEEHDSTKPLFLYFAQQAPHSGNFRLPLQPLEKYMEHLVGIDDKRRKEFAAMVSAMDNSVGEIFEALDKAGMLNNTLFVFTTDNGGVVDGQDGCPGSNFPLKGSKYNLWEGGIRGVSFLWSQQLRHQSRVHTGMMHISDWLPTLLSAAGAPEIVDMFKDIDGLNQWPTINSNAPSPRNEILLNIDEISNVEGFRRGKFKMVKGAYYNETFDGWYDIEGKPIIGHAPMPSPEKIMLYNENYLRYLNHSKVASVLQRKYGRDPLLATKCSSPNCEELRVKCGPRPTSDNCYALKAPCLFNIEEDPCEFYNIAQLYPEITAELESAVDEFRKFLVPAKNKPGDPDANPIYHGGAWVPWES